MTVYELVVPMDNSKELVVGVYPTPDQATSALYSHFVTNMDKEITYILRKLDDQDYM